MTPARKGFASALGAIALLAALFALIAGLSIGVTAYASPSMFRDIGQAGIGLLIAYSITLASAEKSLSNRGSHQAHLSWLGFVVGLGVCGFLGIGLAFGLAAHREAGHADPIDQVGLWWAVSSIGFLGLISSPYSHG